MNHDTIRPNVLKGAVVGAKRGENRRGTACTGGGDIAISYNLILKSDRILNGGKPASRLPTNSFEPTFEDVKKGPARQHPLIRNSARELVPKEKDGGIVEKLEPRPNATTKKRQTERAFKE